MRTALLIFLLVALLLFTGCLAPEPELSDWRWQQFNPEYKPIHPSDRERGSIF